MTGRFAPAAKLDPQTSPAGATAANTVEIKLASNGGTIYVQNHDYFSHSVADYASSVLEDNLVERRLNGDVVEIDLNELLVADLTPTESATESTEDVLTRVELPGIMDRSYFLHSSNKVFAQIKPGLLTILSGSLLNPKLSTYEGRLFPGFCPGPTANMSTLLKGQISDVLKRHLDMGVDAALVEVSEKALLTRYGIDIYVQEFETSAKMIGDAIGIEYVAVDIGRSTPVIAVIALSLIIASAIGLGLAVSILKALKGSVKSFLSYQMLMDAVHKLHGAVSRPQEVQESGDEGAQTAVDATKLVSKTKQRMQRLEQLVDEQTQSSTTFGFIYKGLGLGRSYYQLAEFVINTFRNHRKDSLAEFTKHFMIENASTLQVDGVRHLDFYNEYEVYCTKHHLQIQSIKDNGEKLKALGLYKEIVSGAMTEVFIRLRFRPASSLEALPENPNPGDTSLDLFIDSEVQLTPFDSDCIAVSEFRLRYELFIDKHSDLVEVPITPRMMQKYSSELIRKKLTYVNQFIVPWQPRICSRTRMGNPYRGSLGAAVCSFYLLVMLTAALLMTSSHSEGTIWPFLNIRDTEQLIRRMIVRASWNLFEGV